jgi:hypothetical protein
LPNSMPGLPSSGSNLPKSTLDLPPAKMYGETLAAVVSYLRGKMGEKKVKLCARHLTKANSAP